MKASVIASPFVALTALCFALSAAADCTYPKAPGSIPNGDKATEAEMVQGMNDLKKYDADVNAYLACLDMETATRITEAGPDATPEQVNQIKAIQGKKHNAAVDELQAHAAEFNKQVRNFKQRKKS